MSFSNDGCWLAIACECHDGRYGIRCAHLERTKVLQSCYPLTLLSGAEFSTQALGENARLGLSSAFLTRTVV